MEEKRKYLEYFDGAFDSTVAEKIQPENKPYVAYSKTEGVVYTVIPEPVIGPADNEIWYSTTNHVAYSSLDAAGLTGDSGMTVEILPYDTELDRGVLRFSKDLSELRCHVINPDEDLYDSYFQENTSKIVLPDSVTNIGHYTFGYCRSLTSVTLGNGVTNIVGEAFYNCSSLIYITIPDSVTSIGAYAFQNCKSLTTITIPNSVTEIHGFTFYGCSSLTSIIIPDSVTNIHARAFENCTSLTSLTIGNCVTSIQDRAFDSCTSLTSITFKGTMEEWGIVSKGSGWNSEVPATYVQCSDGQVTI